MSKMEENGSVSMTAAMLKTMTEWKLSALDDRDLPIDGRSLTISTLAAISSRTLYKLKISESSRKDMNENHSFLEGLLSKGTVIYGINTGFGGSADVRCSDVGAIQKSLISHLNAGFGETLDPRVVRAAMAVRINSLSLAYSGVRSEVVQLLCDMIKCDIIPVVPLRGSVSASGDLMPLSYVAACMSGRSDAKVIMHGETISAVEAFQKAGLKFVEFRAKEGLAVINSSSVASALAADVLFDATVAQLLVQIVTALTMESLHGKMESFNDMIHDCLPHAGNKEVAVNVRQLLRNSKFVQHDMEWRTQDSVGSLKQDRYALRTAAQWLGPAVEIWKDSVRRVSVEINSANDNPLVDHRTQEVMHCGNFQGTSCTVAMDQARQALQLCGRLIFAQLSEVLNHTMGHGLPPNLSGCDVSVDFGFKGVDTATASYTSELNHLTSPLTSHVLSAEMHNQSINSLALISARTTQTALTLLQMIICNALCALCQAVDLCWLRCQVLQVYERILAKHNLIQKLDLQHLPCPWYDLVFTPRTSADKLLHQVTSNGYHQEIIEEFVNQMNSLTSDLCNGKYNREIASNMGKGTSLIYLHIRQSIGISFHNGTVPLDVSLSKIYDAIKQRNFVDIILQAFSE